MSTRHADDTLRSVSEVGMKAIDAIVGQKRSMDKIKSILSKDSLRQLLLYGPPGCGKTSTMQAISSYYVARDEEEPVVVFVNASLNRSVRQLLPLIKPLLSLRTTARRVLILDEMDNLAQDAQILVHELLLANSDYVYGDRLVILMSCNDIGRVSDAIVFTVVAVAFDPISPEEMRQTLASHLPKVSSDTGVTTMMNRVIDQSEGDLRRATTWFGLLNLHADAANAAEEAPVMEGTLTSSSTTTPNQFQLVDDETRLAIILVDLAFEPKQSPTFASMECFLARVNALPARLSKTFHIALLKTTLKYTLAVKEEAHKSSLLLQIGKFGLRLSEGAATRLQAIALLLNIKRYIEL